MPQVKTIVGHGTPLRVLPAQLPKILHIQRGKGFGGFAPELRGRRTDLPEARVRFDLSVEQLLGIRNNLALRGEGGRGLPAQGAFNSTVGIAGTLTELIRQPSMPVMTSRPLVVLRARS
eukprot:2458348-Pyramimonas_sp.AAC.1